MTRVNPSEYSLCTGVGKLLIEEIYCMKIGLQQTKSSAQKKTLPTHKYTHVPENKCEKGKLKSNWNAQKEKKKHTTDSVQIWCDKNSVCTSKIHNYRKKPRSQTIQKSKSSVY